MFHNVTLDIIFKVTRTEHGSIASCRLLGCTYFNASKNNYMSVVLSVLELLELNYSYPAKQFKNPKTTKDNSLNL